MASQFTKEFFADLFERNPKAIDRALVVLFQRQTADEQSTSTTRHINERGFAQNDAFFLSELAKKVKRYGSLSPAQRQCALVSRRGKPRLVKYWRQLAEEAEAKKARLQAQRRPTMAEIEQHDPERAMKIRQRQEQDSYECGSW